MIIYCAVLSTASPPISCMTPSTPRSPRLIAPSSSNLPKTFVRPSRIIPMPILLTLKANLPIVNKTLNTFTAFSAFLGLLNQFNAPNIMKYLKILNIPLRNLPNPDSLGFSFSTAFLPSSLPSSTPFSASSSKRARFFFLKVRRISRMDVVHSVLSFFDFFLISVTSVLEVSERYSFSNFRSSVVS